MNGTPNTALHRTPSAAPPSPVSFQTFGAETGVHEVFHERACELAPRSYMRAVRLFSQRIDRLYAVTGRV